MKNKKFKKRPGTPLYEACDFRPEIGRHLICEKTKQGWAVRKGLSGVVVGTFPTLKAANSWLIGPLGKDDL